MRLVFLQMSTSHLSHSCCRHALVVYAQLTKPGHASMYTQCMLQHCVSLLQRLRVNAGMYIQCLLP